MDRNNPKSKVPTRVHKVHSAASLPIFLRDCDDLKDEIIDNLDKNVKEWERQRWGWKVL